MLCMATQQNPGRVLERVPEWTVGDRLRKAREAAHIGVEEMAHNIGRTRNSVTRYERSHTVDVLVVRAYSAFTDTSMEWLLTGLVPAGDGITPGVTLYEHRDNWRDNRRGDRRSNTRRQNPLKRVA